MGADLDVMLRDARTMREDGPLIFSQAKFGVGIPEIADMIVEARRQSVLPVDPMISDQ